MAKPKTKIERRYFISEAGNRFYLERDGNYWRMNKFTIYTDAEVESKLRCGKWTEELS